MNKFKNHGNIWLLMGYLLFWISLILPMNTSLGGLTDKGKSLPVFLNLFYSILSIFILPMTIFDHRDLKDLSTTIEIVLSAGIGICSLLMIFATPFLFFFKKISKLITFMMIASAIYICTAGTVVSYHFYPIRFGHYVWCLSFLIVAVGTTLKLKNQNALS